MLKPEYITKLTTMLFTDAVHMAEETERGLKAVADSYATLAFALEKSPDNARLTRQRFVELAQENIETSFKLAGDDWNTDSQLLALTKEVMDQCTEMYDIALRAQNRDNKVSL